MTKETTSGTSTNVKAPFEEGIGALMADEVIASVDPNAIPIPEGMMRIREFLGKGEKLHLILKGFCERSHKAWKHLTLAQSKVLRALFELMLEREMGAPGVLNEQGGSSRSPAQSGGSGTARAGGGTSRRRGRGKNSRFPQELRDTVKVAVEGGMTPAEVESKFGVPRQTLANWKQDWKRAAARASAAATAATAEGGDQSQTHNQGPNNNEGQGNEPDPSSSDQSATGNSSTEGASTTTS